MIVKGIEDTDFINYKKISMFIAFGRCTLKCDKLNKSPVCQNCKLIGKPDIEISKEEIYNRYAQNPLTKAFVFGGLEPFDSNLELISLIDCIRREFKCNDDIVIYTGYTKEELERGWRDYTPQSELDPALQNLWETIKSYPNIIVKFGRFIVNSTPIFDEVLGVTLPSNNQYAEVISIEN